MTVNLQVIGPYREQYKKEFLYNPVTFMKFTLLYIMRCWQRVFYYGDFVMFCLIYKTFT